MTITDTALRTDSAADRAERLTAAGAAWNERIEADAANAQLTYRVRGSGEGAVATRISSGKHRFLVDEPAALAGDDVAASPVEYALGALISCQVVVYRLYAQALGIALDAVEIEAEDDEAWALRRGLQRGTVVVKVSGRPTDLETVIGETRAHGGTVVSRAGLGLSWISLPDVSGVAAIREALSPRPCAVLDGADGVQDPWPPVDPGVLAVMERIKARFDPAQAFRPGVFVGGL